MGMPVIFSVLTFMSRIYFIPGIINVKMKCQHFTTIFGILTFICQINFMLSEDEHEKSFMTLALIGARTLT